MSDHKKVPSQEEIHAILSRWSIDDGASSGDSKPAAPPAAGAAPPAAAPAADHVAPALPDETREMLNRMSERLETLGAAMERIAQLERGLTETNSAVRLIHQNMQTMTGQVQVVSSRVKGILSNLKATLGYRAKNTYVCVSCRSKGKVAARVKCTHCGQENLWGWWPSQSAEDSNDSSSVHWLWQRWH